jgi:hypothetical protein
MQSAHIVQPAGVGVLAAQVGAGRNPFIQVTVDRRGRLSSLRRDRAVADGDQVEVAHSEHVVAGRQRARHPQVGDPAERSQTACQRLDRVRRATHVSCGRGS